MKRQKTHYEVLQITKAASPEVVRAAWKSLAEIYHTDRGGDPEKIRAINKAYDVLKNPQKRASYDLELAQEQIHPIRRGKRGSSNPVWNPASGAYPDPYPGLSFEEVFGGVMEDLSAGLKSVVDEVSLGILEKMAKNNPLLQKVLEMERAKARKKSS
jgi:curved DNA-binding protein CbpA